MRVQITYDKIQHGPVVKFVPCAVCGKRIRRQRTFTMTDSPYNRNPDGTRSSIPQIYEKLRADANEWLDKKETCTPCLDGRR